MMIPPPIEIARQIRFAQGTVYYVGRFSKAQFALFLEYKEKVEKAYRNRLK